jgi:asparagine synthase (glutamine-hydrolysing)
MLSGGMDSCPAGTIAAQYLVNAGRELTAYCWSLPGFPEADETPQIKECANHAGIRVEFLRAEELGLIDSTLDYPVDLNTPHAYQHSRLFSALYRAAAADGARVMLRGIFGDSLYPGYRYVLAEALADGKLALAFREASAMLRRGGIARQRLSQASRMLVKRALGLSGGLLPPPGWLSEASLALLSDALVRGSAEPHPRPDQYAAVLGDDVFTLAGGHGVLEHREGVITVDPYWDWDLIDFMLSIPAYECFREGQTKYLARLAMRGRMPESLRVRPRGSLLGSFFDGSFERGRHVMREVLTDPSCSWRTYVREDFVLGAFSERPRESDYASSKSKLVAWWAFYYELWRRALAREGLIA